MKDTPLISIVTPMYNSSSFIQKTIWSVKDQSYINWEMIIIDDCSTDDSVKIVAHESVFDNRIKLIRNEFNLGSGKSRNKGINIAKGKYISFLDADDQWLSTKLEEQVRFMEDKNLDFTFTYYSVVDEFGNLITDRDHYPSKVDYYDTLKSNKIGCLTAMYNADSLGKIYMEDIRKRQDYTLWLKILKKTQFAYCIPEILAKYTVRKGSISSNKTQLFKYNWMVLRKIEKQSFIKSAYYLSCHIFYKLINK